MRLSVFLLLAAFAAQISDRPAAGQAGAPPTAPVIAIKVDQVGYLTGAPKVALVAAESPASDFTVRRAAGGAVVFKRKLSAQAADADTGDKVQAADFSAFKTAGK